jgi:hypothetical protein
MAAVAEPGGVFVIVHVTGADAHGINGKLHVMVQGGLAQPPYAISL